MKAYHIMKIANAIRAVAKATRNKWLTRKYIVLLDKAIRTEIKEFRNEQ